MKYKTFFDNINMPTTLEGLHIENTSYEELVQVEERALTPNDTFANLVIKSLLMKSQTQF